MEILALHVLKG